MKRIVLTGGGTAGHVTPNLALVPFLRRDGWEIHYIGGEDSPEQQLIAKVPDVEYHAIACGKLRRYFDPKNFSDPFRVVKGSLQAGRIMGKLKPQVLFSKGGFVSVPVVYGAKVHGIPVVAHESDLTPGLANKLSTPFAKVICCTFPEAAKLSGSKGVCTGAPIREEILQGNRQRGMRRFGFTEGRPVLMVVGGSSGAQAVNRMVVNALPKLLETFQVLHLCGSGNLDASLMGTEGYCQVEYLNEEMADAYAVADVLISRAGSNTLSEILALRKPALLIPYPKTASRGDQILNAQSFESRGLSRVLMQEDMTTDTLIQGVFSLYRDRGEIFEAMSKEESVNGTENVLREIYRYAKKV